MSVTLDHLLEPIAHWLNDQTVEEICSQKPREIWVFRAGRYERHAVPELDADHIEDIAIVAAAQRRMDAGRDMPPLDTDLAGRGRISALLWPLVAEGFPSITIRRGGDFWPTIEDQRKGGTFRKAKARASVSENPEMVAIYREAMEESDADRRSLLLERFFIMAVKANLTIVGAGVTASGKTTMIRSCIRAIPNPDERIVVIGDTPEMNGLEDYYPNSVQIFYDRNETREGMKAEDLIVAALRMRPQRLILQEVRDGPAGVAFVDGLMSGHKGMTSIHATSCKQAIERLKFIYKKTSGGAAVNDPDLLAQLGSLIDVIVHFQPRAEGESVAIDEIWFRECQDWQS